MSVVLPATQDFFLNGEERTASSNHFTIGKLFDVQLKAVSPEDQPTHVGLKTDTESITDNIIQLVGSYNEFIKTAPPTWRHSPEANS